MYYVGATIKSSLDDWSIIVREQAAFTLWALAGSQKPQRKMIAEKIGISQILSMIMSKSERLQYVGAKCLQSLVLENVHNQNLIIKENGIEQIIRLLKAEKASNRVVLATVEAVAALCFGIAHVNNELTQNELYDKGAVEILIDILNRLNNKHIHVETAHALACLMLNRHKDETVNGLIKMIDIKSIINLMNTDDLELRLKAGLAVTVFAYNNNDKQYDIRKSGGIEYESYRCFFEDPTVNSMQLCKACFQVVVLARTIKNVDLISITAMAISRLVNLLLIDEEQVVIQTASYMSSLAHTRAGITDAMIACDAVDILCDHLFSRSDEIRYNCAVALGYLTFNRTASRLLLHNCRNLPHLFKTLMSLLEEKNDKISRQFVESFETALALGLPKLLVKNRVKFYDVSSSSSANNAQRRNLSSVLSSHLGQSPMPDTDGEETGLDTLTSIAHRSQSAPLLAKGKQQTNSAAAAKNSKLIRPTLGIRPVTQLSFKRNKF